MKNCGLGKGAVNAFETPILAESCIELGGKLNFGHFTFLRNRKICGSNIKSSHENACFGGDFNLDYLT